MLVRMAEAIGRLVLSGREMTRLAGWVLLSPPSTHVHARTIHTHTHAHTLTHLPSSPVRYTARVSELMVVLRDMERGVYERTMVSGGTVETVEDGEWV